MTILKRQLWRPKGISHGNNNKYMLKELSQNILSYIGCVQNYPEIQENPLKLAILITILSTPPKLLYH